MPSRSRRLLQLEDCAVARLEHAARAALVAEVVELVGVPDVIAVGRGVQRVAAVVAQIPVASAVDCGAAGAAQQLLALVGHLSAAAVA